MPQFRLQAAAILVAALAACSSPDDEGPTAPPGPDQVTPDQAPPQAASPERGRHERLAARMAKALRNPAFRATLAEEFARSEFPEKKLHLQGFLARDGGAERRRFAQLAGDSESALEEDLAGGPAVEVYFPVREHRARWHGGTDLIVATAEVDADRPVAFDLMGRRLLLDRDRPPSTPVLMVSRAELDFSRRPQAISECIFDCSGGDVGGGGTAGQGLYMTGARYSELFESWFKGDPEFEVHILGQATTGNGLATWQCAGEHALGPYRFDQNGVAWEGSVLLMSAAQLAQYNQQFPGKNVRVFVVEDDDTSCEIKIDSTRSANLFKAVKQAYGDLTGGNKSTTIPATFNRAPIYVAFFKALTSWIKTQDDPVGNAVEDPMVAGAVFPGANWAVRGENNVLNGAIRLEMR